MKRHLGIDYGSKRIGIAVSDPLNIIATPRQYILNDSKVNTNFQALFAEYEIGTIVIGMPYNLKGEKSHKAEEVERFIANILSAFQLEIVRWDERFSTKQAQRTMIDMNVKKKQRQSKEFIDSMAAAIMLQSYLDGK